MLEQLLDWDKQWFVFLNGLGTPTFDQFWITVTHIETWIPLYVACMLLFFLKLDRKEAFFRVVMVVLLFFTVYYSMHFTKEFFERPRPNNAIDLQGIIRALKNPQDFSFFSGHAATSFAFTSFVYLSLKNKLRWIGILFIWPVLFAYSRIYVGVHYPIDIITGTLIGFLFGVLFYQLSLKISGLYLK